ncbi:MAG: hypothetical protein AAGC81_03400 [Pseudomonadota bacterium]
MGWIRYLPTLLVLPLSLGPVLLGHRHLPFVDDAYYYMIIADSILASGESAAMPGVLTNGYHPLWLGVLVAVGSIVDLTPFAIRIVEIVCILAGFAILIWTLQIRSVLGSAVLVLALMPLLERVALLGMETSLLFTAMALFLGLMLNPSCVSRRIYWPLVALAAILTVAARLDAVFFVGAILLAVSGYFWARLGVLAALSAALIAYMLINAQVFGAAMPVSGAVKALGAPLLNTLYFPVDELSWSGLASLFDQPIAYVLGDLAVQGRLLVHFLVLPWVLCALSLLIMAAIPAGASGSRQTRRVLLGAVGGFGLFGAKLMFGTSWIAWSWYGYPAFVLLLPLVMLLREILGELKHRGVFLAALAIALVAVNQHRLTREVREPGWFQVNREFVDKVRPIVGNQPIAMGDRAGSFAWDLGTGLFQIEGLLNDAEYVAHLRRGGEQRGVICAAGVRFFVSYEPPLGAYESYRAPIFQPGLTLVDGGYVTVLALEQRASLVDPEGYGPDFAKLPNPAIYLWELDCAQG